MTFPTVAVFVPQLWPNGPPKERSITADASLAMSANCRDPTLQWFGPLSTKRYEIFSDGTVPAVLFQGRSVGRHRESKRTGLMDQAYRHLQLELFEQEHPKWEWFPDKVQTEALEIIALLLVEHVANNPEEETDAQLGD